MKILNWFKEQYIKIQKSDNQPSLDEIFALKVKITEWTVQHEADVDYIKTKKAKIIELETEVLDLKYDLEKINIHSSFENFMKFLTTNTKPITKYYNFRGVKFRPSRKLRYTKSEAELAWNFIDKMLKFKHDKINHNNADELLYYFNLAFIKKFPSKEWYITDQKNYNKADFWASFRQIYNNIKSGKLDDCDGFMVFKYVLIIELLLKYYPTEIKRLRGMIVGIRNGGTHAILTWIRGQDVNDFVPIETTYMENQFALDWKKKYTMMNNQFYVIQYSFDQDNEYIKY